MLLEEGSSKTGLFSHLSNRVFRTLQFRKYISYRVIFFSFLKKCSKFDLKLKNPKDNDLEKVVCFLDNSI